MRKVFVSSPTCIALACSALVFLSAQSVSSETGPLGQKLLGHWVNEYGNTHDYFSDQVNTRIWEGETTSSNPYRIIRQNPAQKSMVLRFKTEEGEFDYVYRFIDDRHLEVIFTFDGVKQVEEWTLIDDKQRP